MEKVDNDQIKKAVKALLKHCKAAKSSSEGEKSLLDHSVDFWLVISTKLISEKTRTTPQKICLPHPIFTKDDHEICLITKDPQRQYKDLLEKKEITAINKVIGITKLKKKYKPYEAKRNLCNAYDLFLADERVLPLLPRILGKTFFDRKKLPLPVNLTKVDLGKELEKAIGCTYYYESTGSCNSIRVARDKQEEEEIYENILAALEQAVDKIPRKWDNVKSIHLKTSESVALPVYVCTTPLERMKNNNNNNNNKKVKKDNSSKEKSTKSDFIDIYADKDDDLMKKLSKVVGMTLVSKNKRVK